ncbi:MAG: hypothetical protein U5K70_06525 [Halodesulfurarchaeum sp.]|nr:hypothetical protein [Halodesulfurarchaeum sp.]
MTGQFWSTADETEDPAHQSEDGGKPECNDGASVEDHEADSERKEEGKTEPGGTRRDSSSK